MDRRLILVIVASMFARMGVGLTPDGLALVAFKRGLTVTSPLLENWNPRDASPCSWGGITCTASGDVQNISLSAQIPVLEGNISSSLGTLKSLQGLFLDSNSLSGSIPPELGNCSSLIQLWLSYNLLTGPIPESLGNLKNLGSFNVIKNSLTGEIPVSLASLPNLYEFAVDSNYLSGLVPPEIYRNLNLKFFAIGKNQFTPSDLTTALEDLSMLPAIEIIGIYQLNFSGTFPPAIGNATKLVFLDLFALSGFNTTSYCYSCYSGGGDFGGQIPKEIGKLVNLIELNLLDNSFSGEIPPEVGNMTSLQNFQVGNNSLNGTIPSSLGNLVNLQNLMLYANNLTGQLPVSVATLPNLQILHLAYNSLTGPIPTDMSKMATSLQQIYLHENYMSGPISEDFGRFMPNLNTFDIGNNFFNGTLPDGLCEGNNLQYLNLGGNYLQGAIPSSLVSCKTLIEVSFGYNWFTSIPNGLGSNSTLQLLLLNRCRFTGQLPTGLGANSQLVKLDLSENEFTGDISVLEFSQLAQNLSWINLARNNFTGEIPAAMALCTSLFQVDMSYNFLSGSIPPTFSNLAKLQVLMLQHNNLTGLDPSTFSTTLTTLDLAQNPWNQPIPLELGTLRTLRSLNLSYGGFTGPIPPAFGQLIQLEVLDLSHNNLTGEVPRELGELMTSLSTLNISFNNLTGPLPPAWVELFKSQPDSFLGNPGLCLGDNATTNACMNMTSSILPASGRHAKLSAWVVVAMALGVASAVLLVIAFLRWRCKPAKMGTNQTPRLEEIIIQNLTKAPFPFTFQDIMVATENLSDAYIIGRGSHGVVYKAVLAAGTPMAVKKIESQDMTPAVVHKSFWREIETVGNAKHRNLVRLLGFVKWAEVGFLLYDYIPNGDLHSVLHNKEQVHDIDLTWKARLRIAEGVAHGLAYLHHDYNPPIVHRDIKSSNVLLGTELEAHISDFGLAKVLLAGTMPSQSKQLGVSTSNVYGTYGYIAPEVGYDTEVTPKLDVYSFGVLLLELLTGRQPADPSFGETWHVVEWVKKIVLQNGGKMSELVLDPSLLNPTNLAGKDDMLSVLRIALLCTRENTADRPTMRDVADLLRSISQKMEMRNENWDTGGGGGSTSQ